LEDVSEEAAATDSELQAAAGEPTGVASVDVAQARLRDVDESPVEAHVEIFDDVQRQLHDALAELDDGS
jgi:hypothetical protein